MIIQIVTTFQIRVLPIKNDFMTGGFIIVGQNVKISEKNIFSFSLFRSGRP